jgi:hypothetical protein
VTPYRPERPDTQLELHVADPVLRRILLEEWAFLQERSWIASRLRRPFRTFLNAGAAALELSERAFDAVAAGTLKIRGEELPPALSPGQRLRAVTKWVAVGGSGWASALEPILAGPVATTLAGFFVLFDP